MDRAASPESSPASAAIPIAAARISLVILPVVMRLRAVVCDGKDVPPPMVPTGTEGRDSLAIIPPRFFLRVSDPWEISTVWAISWPVAVRKEAAALAMCILRPDNPARREPITILV